MRNLINEIREKLDKLEAMVIAQETKAIFAPCTPHPLPYVDLTNGSMQDKMQRIVEQIKQYNINLLPTPHESQFIRSAIVAEFGEKGLRFWLDIRKLREDYNEEIQIKRYNSILKSRSKNTMTFGAIVNRYRNAIDLYNENNSTKSN